MPEFLNDMEFETKLNEMGDNQLELLKFVARQQYQTSKLCPVHNARIKSLENKNKKLFGVVGSIGAIIGSIIAVIVDYILRRNG